MSTTDQVKIVLLCEFANNCLAKCKADTSIVLPVLVYSFLWIGPEQVAKEPSVRHISRTHDVTDLFQILQLGREATMHAEDLLIDERSHR